MPANIIRQEGERGALFIDISYFDDNDSPGLCYIDQAVQELKARVTSETTVSELFAIQNAVFARAMDLMLEDIQKQQTAKFG